MSKKNKILIITIIGVVVLCLLGILYFASKNQDDNNAKSDSFGSMQNKANSSDTYYVEKGIEDPAEMAEKAVEEYIKQDINEPKADRSKRLQQYFVNKKSSVFTDEIHENMSGKVTSVTSCEEQEGGDWCLLVMTDLTINNQVNLNRTYWITVQENKDGSFTATDIGVWE